MCGVFPTQNNLLISQVFYNSILTVSGVSAGSQGYGLILQGWPLTPRLSLVLLTNWL